MVKSLRKRHLQIWTALAVLLPVGIISAWMVIPNEQYIRLLKPSQVDALPVVYRSMEKNSYNVRLLTNEAHTKWQLNWKNNCVLTVPSAVIYAGDNMGADLVKRQVGRIESTGDYIFPLEADSIAKPPSYFILYDFIHEQAVDTIHF